LVARQILLHKISSPQGDNRLFPTEIPTIAVQLLGGRVAERSGYFDIHACRWQAYNDLSMVAPTTHRNNRPINRNLLFAFIFLPIRAIL